MATSSTTKPPAPLSTEAAETEKDPVQAAKDEAAVLAEAEAKGANLAKPGTQAIGKVTGAMYAEAHGEGTVKMNFPEAMSLTLPDYTMISFDPGIQEVPASVADHEYLKAQGATKV